MFYFSSATSVKTLILQGTCCIFLHNFCPKDSFYWEHVLLSSTTSVRNTHSTGNVMYFSPQLLSETLILQGTCCIFLHNFCPKHSFYWERVLLSSATSVRNTHSTGNVLYFSPQLLSETFLLLGTCFTFLNNFCPKHSFYRERVLFFPTTSVRNIPSTGNVFYFPPQLLSETFIVKGTCFFFSPQLLPETLILLGTCFIFPTTYVSNTFHYSTYSKNYSQDSP